VNGQERQARKCGVEEIRENTASIPEAPVVVNAWYRCERVGRLASTLLFSIGGGAEAPFQRMSPDKALS
jgi:hypothetical protein